MADNRVTTQTIRKYFDDRIHRGQPLLPDPGRVGGYGTYQKYTEIVKIMSGHPNRILDVGCNRGSIEYLFKSKFEGKSYSKPFIVGIDISRAAIRQAQALGLDRVTFFPYDGDVLPFKTDSFDLVIMVEVIEHIIDKKNTLSEIARVLKPGGHLIMTTPNPACWALRIEQAIWVILRKIFRKPNPQKDVYIGAQNLAHLVEASGFTITNPNSLYSWPRAFIHLWGWSIFPPLPPFLLLAYQKLWLALLKRVRLPSFIQKKIMWTVWIQAELTYPREKR